MNLVSIAKHLPRNIKQPLSYIYSALPPRIRYSKAFWETYDFLQESQWWGRKRLEEYQLFKLKELIAFCHKYVPFYQKRWAEAGTDVNSINDFSDFSKLPFTTKEDIKESADEMVPTILPRKRLLKTRTSGTTGSPANFYATKEATDRELAFFVTYWAWHGCNFFKDKIASFRGSYKESQQITRSGNRYYFPTWNLSRERLTDYIKFINAQKIAFIHGYPSLIYELFRSAQETGSALKTVKAVFFASEKAYAYQSDFIQENFSVPVYCHYGHNERVALFLQCQFNDAYHIIPEYGYVEFEPLNNGELFEIIATGFLNKGTPLIRYRTEDYAVLQSEMECNCGRKYPKTVKDVIGRTGDMLITPSGKLIQPNHLEYAIRHVAHFSDCQIIQDDPAHLRVLIVPSEGYTSDDGEGFKKNILWRLGEDMGIDIELVDSITRPPSLKKRFTINLLKEKG
jgi:phenylacetate-CoA ligase